jgi:hypothetical protein
VACWHQHEINEICPYLNVAALNGSAQCFGMPLVEKHLTRFDVGYVGDGVMAGMITVPKPLDPVDRCANSPQGCRKCDENSTVLSSKHSERPLELGPPTTAYYPNNIYR